MRCGGVILMTFMMLTKVTSVEIIGHRGSPFEAEENTIASFKKAFEQGADGIEGDFWLTADENIVCSHDPISCSVDICRCSLEEIRRSHPHMPTLQEVLGVVPSGKKIYIEIKRGTEILPYVEKILDQSHLKLDQIIFLSFDEDVVRQLRKKMPSVPTYYSIAFLPINQRPHQFGKSVLELFQQAISLDASGLCLQGSQDQIAEILSLQKKPLPWVVWTVDEKEDAIKFKQMGAQGIITNRPLKIREEIF